NQFAYVLSLSHIIADGYIYYRLLSMLTCKLTPIVAFSPVRKAAFNEERWRAVGRSEYDFIFSPGFLLNCLTSKLLRGTPRCHAYLINQEKVRELKALAAEDEQVQYLSTNDILFSSFAKLFGARACSMAVNFRGRLANVTEEDAGNYQGLLWFGPEDVASPSLVRATLEQGRLRGVYRRCGSSPARPLPDFWETIRSRMAAITSWVFNDEPILEGCQVDLHLPHFDLDEVNTDLALLFKARPGQPA
ncbi:unnamed protein product, partial [Symbiodinium pilosum]